MLIKLIAIYVDDQIIYNNMILSEKNKWFPEYLNVRRQKRQNEMIAFLKKQQNIIQQLQGEIGCKQHNASSTCKENPFCCTSFERAVTVAGMAGGKHKGGKRIGGAPDKSPIKLVLNIKYEKDNKNDDKTIVLTIINNEIPTTDIADLPTEILSMIKENLEGDIRRILAEFNKNKNYNILEKAIENAIGICNLYYIIHSKFSNEELKKFNTNTAYDTEVKTQILNLFDIKIDNKNEFIDKLLQFFHEPNKDIMSNALIADPTLFSQKPNIYMSLVAFYEIYKVIKNLINNTIDECLKCLLKKDLFETNIWIKEGMKGENYIFSAVGEMIDNLRDDENNTFFIEFESIGITIHYKYITKMFKIFKTYNDESILFNGNIEKNKTLYDDGINKIKNDALKNAIINISHMQRFENLQFYIPDELSEGDKMRFNKFIFDANTELTNINTNIVSIIPAVSKSGGGASKKIRLNDYTVINGRKHVLYKGPRGGLYVLIKGKFKHV